MGYHFEYFKNKINAWYRSHPPSPKAFGTSEIILAGFMKAENLGWQLNSSKSYSDVRNLVWTLIFFVEVYLNLIKIRSFCLQLKDLTKPHTKVKSCDLSIMHDNNVMLRPKLSSDWLNTHLTKRGFLKIL